MRKNIHIIGGGISGLYLAYYLQDSEFNITLYEKELLGSGASTKNAGFITPGSFKHFINLYDTYGEAKAIEIYKYCFRNIELTKNIFKDSNLLHNWGGHTILKEGDYSKYLSAINQSGFTVTKSEENIYSVKEECSVDPIALFNYLKTKVNIQIKENTEYDQSECDFRVWATNNFPGQTQPVRAQIARYKIKGPTDFILRGNVYYSPERIYFRVEDDILIAGGKRLVDEQTEYTDVMGVNSLIQAELKKTMCSILGTGLETITEWSGIMAFTSNEMPILEINDSEIFFGGMSGHGNGFAAHMAFEISEYIKNSTSLRFQSF